MWYGENGCGLAKLTQVPPRDRGSSLEISVSAIYFTPMWNPTQDRDFNSSERIRKILQDGGTQLLPEAVEKELSFREIKGKMGIDYYFRITDKAPSIKAGEYRYMNQGGIPVSNLLVMFTILSNEKDSVDIPIAREIIANAIQK